jgi:hypothetical protein
MTYWRTINGDGRKILPRENQKVLWLEGIGRDKPLIISGWYNPEHPDNPFRTVMGNAFDMYGLQPTHWMYLSEIM